MKVVVFVKASPEYEAGQMPSTELLTRMGRYNEELVKAGIMLAGDGLKPSSKSKRVRFEGKKKTVIDGPFAETKELVAGYWIWQVRSMEEAVEWLKRAPFDGGEEVEIRPVFETEDFGANLTPELRERFGLADDINGVVITDIDNGGPSADKGMKAGDVVVEVAQDDVKTTDQILSKLDEAKKAGRKSVLLLVDRQGDLRFVAVKIDS